jgi:methylmalonyl-CoA/ethylmalonyl-CoA epimerase
MLPEVSGRKKLARFAAVQLPLDHVGIAVQSLDAALPLYELLTGGRSSPPERIATQGVTVVFVGDGAGRLELIEPTGPDSPVARFLERRGPGIHHLAYRVNDIEAALRSLSAAGIALIDRVARPGAHGRRVAFLDPHATGGVLIELVEAE